ncbi:fasciclin-like arabinogalactan protein 1 [Hordeum vulgare subsp. vulgare]|uniref:FAS1 domain-containing protein n=1 Tax=Hordeum vulgare subsp. vulgare TaxID=112509 RepID=A0A8I6YX21_HORVV|nr:fasciclin-like arabinogalactan protein 1 [Hordeum vulgare subsp. vulgare]
MSLPGALTASSFAVLLLLVLSTWPTCHATHNITAILAARRDMSEFSRLLTMTGLADEINERNTITVLAVDDADMAPLKARHLSREALRHVLSLHVLVDYYDHDKLHRLPGGSADVSTLFQASGDAPGSAGMVEISERRGGSVAFVPQDAGDDARATSVLFVKPIHEEPYNIAVLQVGAVMSSPAAEAPSSPETSAPISRHKNATDVAPKTKKGTGSADADADADAPSADDGDDEREDRAKKNGAIGAAPGRLSLALAFLLAIKIVALV